MKTTTFTNLLMVSSPVVMGQISGFNLYAWFGF